MKYLFILSLVITSLQSVMAQESNVAFKVSDYSYKYSHNLKVKTNCEMAEIILTKGGSDKVDIKCTYSAKHADKGVATRELQRHNIRVRKTLNEIFISNFFTIVGNEKEPKAKLKIVFEISIPDSVNVDIENNFGSCKVVNLRARGSINQDFGKVDLVNVNGNLKIKGDLSELNISKFNGSLDIRHKSGDIMANDVKGNLLFIQNSNAKINLSNIDNSVNVKMYLSNCELKCKSINYSKHSVSVESYKEPIIQEGNMPVEKKGELYFIHMEKPLPGFIIKASYSKINL